MLSYTVINFTSLLTGMIQKPPGKIVGPITQVLGYILNFIFEFAYSITPSGINTLGLSIILLTIVTRALMLPLAFKQQKSMVATQRIAPEMDKIKKKYGGSKDPEIQQKMNQEIQALYAKHKINPLAGCLPLFIQLPIFIALSYMMQQSYLFINKIGILYEQIANLLLKVPDYATYANDILRPLAFPKIPKKMVIDLAQTVDLEKVLNKLSMSEWSVIAQSVPADISAQLDVLLQQKHNIEHFMGINLIDKAGYGFPGILIPILAAATTFLSSYLMNKQTKSADASAQATQKVMLYAMPLMIGFMTVGMPCGVGLYWITTTAFQVVQQMVMNKYYFPKEKTAE